jgi:hypothetical protein
MEERKENEKEGIAKLQTYVVKTDFDLPKLIISMNTLQNI